MTKVLVVVLIVVAGVALGMFWNSGRKKREAQAMADAREDALRWYERLGGQIMNLSGDQPAVKQALVDAGERYNAAGSQLERATSARQYELARETALEGLAYVRAARTALGLDPGPDIPPLAAARGAGSLTKDREVDVQGHQYRAGPNPSSDTPYYYPGGRVQGRPVPAGWYSEPWWKTALYAGAGTIGSLLLFDALFSPAWGDPGYAYDDGFQQGLDYADDHGWDPGGDGGDGGDSGDGGDGGGDWGGDGGGDWGGGDFGGGDFGGGDW
jgi:uncharacterized membrane protein YgcG